MRFLSGACMFFLKKNYDLIGGFDDNFFLYFEENDFCKRSIKFYKNYQINKIKLHHNAGNSVTSKMILKFKIKETLGHGILYGQNSIIIEKITTIYLQLSFFFQYYLEQV